MRDDQVENREIQEETAFCPACSERRKKRTPEEQKALIKRLRLAEGQIRGIQKMVENDAYCPDILIQVSAVTSALNSFNKELLACHIHSWPVAKDSRSRAGSEDLEEGAIIWMGLDLKSTPLPFTLKVT